MDYFKDRTCNIVWHDQSDRYNFVANILPFAQSAHAQRENHITNEINFDSKTFITILIGYQRDEYIGSQNYKAATVQFTSSYYEV